MTDNTVDLKSLMELLKQEIQEWYNWSKYDLKDLINQSFVRFGEKTGQKLVNEENLPKEILPNKDILQEIEIVKMDSHKAKPLDTTAVVLKMETGFIELYRGNRILWRGQKEYMRSMTMKEKLFGDVPDEQKHQLQWYILQLLKIGMNDLFVRSELIWEMKDWKKFKKKGKKGTF